MPKITARAALLTAAILLTLTGCTPSPADAYSAPERAFLDRIAAASPDRDAGALVEAGHAACEQVQAGRNISQVLVFTDDADAGGYYRDSLPVTIAAVSELCP